MHLRPRIRIIVEAGLIDKWKYQYWPRDDECSWKGDGSSDDQTLYVTDFVGYFLLLLVGKSLHLFYSHFSAYEIYLLGIGIAVPVLLFEALGPKRNSDRELSTVKPFTP